MGSTRKRDNPAREETKEERKARKRQKKEAKKRKEESQESSENQQMTTKKGPTVATAHDDKSNLLSSKKMRLVASILPSGLGDVQTCVDRCISEFLMKYSESVGGIMMAYRNVNIITKTKGRIVEELPHIHYDVTCDALVFTPIPKAQLKGRVTESFHSHISLVVMNYFNASISAAHLREAGFEYDVTKDLWYDTESEYVIEKASSIIFAIDKFHEAVGMISIDGCSPKLEV